MRNETQPANSRRFRFHTTTSAPDDNREPDAPDVSKVHCPVSRSRDCIAKVCGGRFDKFALTNSLTL
jgi:hypothetical protein